MNWKYLIIKHLVAVSLIYTAIIYFPPFNIVFTLCFTSAGIFIQEALFTSDSEI